MSFTGEPQPRTLLRPWVLLMLLEQPDYGYDLLERLRPHNVGESDPAGVYRALRMLESDGLVTSRWDTEGPGPARRNYEVTALGVRSLEEWSAGIEQTRDQLACYLERYADVVHARSGRGGRR